MTFDEMLTYFTPFAYTPTWKQMLLLDYRPWRSIADESPCILRHWDVVSLEASSWQWRNACFSPSPSPKPFVVPSSTEQNCLAAWLTSASQTQRSLTKGSTWICTATYLQAEIACRALLCQYVCFILLSMSQRGCKTLSLWNWQVRNQIDIDPEIATMKEDPF